MEDANFKSGFATLIGQAERWKIDTDESSDRTEDRDHIK